jgi:hypothetical protein
MEKFRASVGVNIAAIEAEAAIEINRFAGEFDAALAAKIAAQPMAGSWAHTMILTSPNVSPAIDRVKAQCAADGRYDVEVFRETRGEVPNQGIRFTLKSGPPVAPKEASR